MAHPPGYPLFILYEKLFALLLFFGSVAWRMNVGMAFAGATAAGIIFLTAAHLVNERGAALLAAGLFALNPIVWTYSTQAEVPPPHPPPPPLRVCFLTRALAPKPSLPSRTNWTRLVPPPVLTGHASSLPPCAGVPAQQLACRGAALPRRAATCTPTTRASLRGAPSSWASASPTRRARALPPPPPTCPGWRARARARVSWVRRGGLQHTMVL